MVQTQERVRTRALGCVRIGLLKELRFTLDFTGFHIGVENI